MVDLVLRRAFVRPILELHVVECFPVRVAVVDVSPLSQILAIRD